MKQLLLGVDGGATKTVALVADGSGQVLGAGRAGSSDIHSESPPQAVGNVVASVLEALGAAQVKVADLGACVFGLCGADWPEDVAYYEAALRSRLTLRAVPTVTNDAFNSLRAGADDGVGVALVLGTGGAVAAHGPDGAEWFSGERMERAGALELGRVAFDALMRAEYAEGPRPACEPAALRVFGVDSVEAMVYAITRSGGTGYRSVARLAPALLDAAHDGDAPSQQLVRAHGQRMASYVRAAGRRVGLTDQHKRVVMAGGLLRHPGSHLRDSVTADLPDYVVSTSPLEPAHGALLMAADSLGVHIPAERLAVSGPEPDFFATAEGA
jgi:N-acetylglucosamine kinase-like BadF-type ATPase